MHQEHHSLTEYGLPLFSRRIGHIPDGSRAVSSAQPAHVLTAIDQAFRPWSEASQDKELLELILLRVIPERDVKPIACSLLETFGDINRVITAPRQRLLTVAGVGDDVIAEFRLLEICAKRMARARVMRRPVISGWQALLDYCHTMLAHRETEQFRVLFLDRKNMLIADEVLGEGTVDHVPVYPREVMRRALELNATALILVHNHPSGDPAPSEADISMTRSICAAADALSITLHDHLIIGKSCEISFRSEGLLQP